MKTLKSAAALAILLAAGCSQPAPPEPTPLEVYEQALSVHRMELESLREVRELGGMGEKLEQHEQRVQQAKAAATQARKNWEKSKSH